MNDNLENDIYVMFKYDCFARILLSKFYNATEALTLSRHPLIPTKHFECSQY